MTRQEAMRAMALLASVAWSPETLEAAQAALGAISRDLWPGAHRANVRRRSHRRRGLLEGRAIYCGETVCTYGYEAPDRHASWNRPGPWGEPWTRQGPRRQNRSWHLADCPEPLRCPGCWADHGREETWRGLNALDRTLNT